MYEEVHNLVYHGGGGFLYSEVYNMPIHLRRYSLRKVNEFLMAKKEAQEKAYKNAENKRR